MKFPDWFGNPLFCHMTSLCLFKCVHCRSLPPLGQLPCLESLDVDGLDNVEGMGQEIYGDIDKPFPSLKVLRIGDMCNWREWYIPENGVFSCLEELGIADCPKLIVELPKQLPLPSLRKFYISECPGLVNCHGQMTIFGIDANFHQRFCSLRKLRISGIPKLKEISSSDLKTLLPTLEKLVIIGCSDKLSFPINCLPKGLKQLRIGNFGYLKVETREMAGSCHLSLEKLKVIGGTDSLTNLWHTFPNLQHLEISVTDGLSIAQGSQNLTSLRVLTTSNCGQFYAFPSGGFSATNLTDFYIWNCWNLKSLPERMLALLPSLRYLSLTNCPEIECFPEGGLPSRLQYLRISSCEKLERQRRKWGLERLLSLVRFYFRGTYEESLLLEDLSLPCTLKSLVLGNHSNVKGLNYVVLQPLTALESLELWSIPKRQSLLGQRLPSSISKLEISKCPLPKPRLEWEKGEDWPKVVHISSVVVDGELIP